jgi:hypothetical protein
MKRIPFFILIYLPLFFSLNTPVLSYGDQPNEEVYREIGYTTVDVAAKEFENHFKESVTLPLRVPPIPFTHVMGRFNDMDDSFEVKYINEKTQDNHYKITIRPIQQKLQYKNEEVIKTIKLQDGNEAVYLNHSGFNVLIFEKDNWQYMLSINKRSSELMLPGTLVQIANSIDSQES